jgi:glycosyltransferase involved in cell wall biosynthesis
MRIALVYDCLYPRTVGGAERWLRELALALASEHDVTYVTRRQWGPDEDPIPGVRCLGVAPGGPLYTAAGRRRLAPALRFGARCFLHFVRNRRRYDIVHCLSYPYMPLVAVRAALLGARGPALYCEWLECLSDGWWRAYGGPVAGAAGRLLQRLCIRLSPAAFVFSDLTASRLRAAGFSGSLHRLGGLWTGGAASPLGDRQREELVVFAGRHMPDKGVELLPDAIAYARRARPKLRAVIAGDGPLRERVLRRVDGLGLAGSVSVPGFLDRAELDALYSRAGCVAAPSVRDGYGMAVAEAAGAGTPVVVCRSADSATGELVEEGVNGAFAARPAPREIGEAIVRVLDGGEELRARTQSWFAENRGRLSMAGSIARVKEIYAATPSGGSRQGSHSATV